MAKKTGKFGTGIGIGYVSVIMIFSVLCLTILAVLSISSSDSARQMSARSSEYLTSYYSADSKAARILSELDRAALEAHESGFFEDSFMQSELPEGVRLSPSPEGVSAEYSVPVNERTELRLKVTFYSEPEMHSGKRYKVNSRKTCSAGGDEEDNRLNVWDGSSF